MVLEQKPTHGPLGVPRTELGNAGIKASPDKVTHLHKYLVKIRLYFLPFQNVVQSLHRQVYAYNVSVTLNVALTFSEEMDLEVIARAPQVLWVL